MKDTGIKIDGYVLMSLLMVIIFAAIIIVAQGYPIKPRIAPMMVAVPGLAMSIAVLISEIQKAKKDAAIKESDAETSGEDDLAAKEQKASETRKQEIIFILWMVAVLVIILLFGFLIGMVIFIPFFLRLQGKEAWKVTLLYTIFTWLSIYVLFYRLLRIPLFEGFLLKILS